MKRKKQPKWNVTSCVNCGGSGWSACKTCQDNAKLIKKLHKMISAGRIPIEHNQCNLCLKKFKTALGFHKHYHWCLENNRR